MIRKSRFIPFIISAGLLVMAPYLSAEADSGGITPDEFVRDVTRISGYDVQLIGTWPANKQISMDPLQGSINQWVKGLLDKFHLAGYVIAVDKDKNLIKIIFPEKTVPDPVGPLALSKETDYDIFAGITPESMARLRENQSLMLESRSDDTLIYPYPDDSPGISLGVLKELKNDYKLSQELQSDDDEIEPASAYGPAITRGELREIRQNYDDMLVARSGFSVIYVTPDDDVGITLQELDSMRKSYHNNPETDIQIPLSPYNENYASEHDKGL